MGFYYVVMGFYYGALAHFNFIIYYDTYFPKALRGVIWYISGIPITFLIIIASFPNLWTGNEAHCYDFRLLCKGGEERTSVYMHEPFHGSFFSPPLDKYLGTRLVVV